MLYENAEENSRGEYLHRRNIRRNKPLAKTIQEQPGNINLKKI